MSTLADELLQDFEDSGSENGEREEDDEGDDTAAIMGLPNGDLPMDDTDLMSSDEEADQEMRDAKVNDEDPVEKNGKTADLRSATSLVKTLDSVLEVSRITPSATPFTPSGSTLGVAGQNRDTALFTSVLSCYFFAQDTAALTRTSLDATLQKIKHFQAQSNESRNEYIGNVEEHPEYHLLTQANSLSTAITNEVVVVHKWIRDHYSVRFPELETLVTNPLEYAKTAAVLGNVPLNSDTMRRIPQSTDNPLGVSLDSVLDKPTLMIVTTSAITSKGQPMAQGDLDGVIAACGIVIKLDAAKRALTDYVQSRMTIFAPNLTALIGSLTAAQLLNTAGGLTGLSKTPACNIAAWGSKKGANVSALATNVTSRQQGHLYLSPIIRTVPTDLKKQAMRIVSAKVVLAARVDRIHSSPDGSQGKELKEQCLERLEKLQEKPLNTGHKALPVPDDKPSRKRGGRRARQAKAATAVTDLRKAQNRMLFGQEEKEVGYGYGDETAGMGMIGAASDGRVRALQVDQRTRAKLSAKNKGWGGLASSVNGGGGVASSLRGTGQAAGGLDLRGHGLRATGVGTTVSSQQAGTMSSLAFTPVQGLELVDPSVRAEMGRKRKAEEDRYFKGGTFTQIGGGGAGGFDGVFKKPALPPSKRLDTGDTKK
ncbi:U4/U6-U5 snRNP complex subunit prp31 [Sporothrix epigloea]|uniref:U4/U6-U5 snRNP complex subunit prp31 n=1 Tax=Sporothrix epigloea TaxID=1892477 RepID=A0ABP0DH66_9PEZI